MVTALAPPVATADNLAVRLVRAVMLGVLGVLTDARAARKWAL